MHASSALDPTLPIGVFDSGVGGLTVLRALREALPHESFVYLGDTARLPYGIKSRESVLRYSVQAADFLHGCGVKSLVIACNTASAVGVDSLRERLSPTPVIGVVEPGAVAACSASGRGHILVAATEGTVRGGAYQRAIARLRPDATVLARACSLFVGLAEEGWTEGVIAAAVAKRYLGELLERDPLIDVLLLGCTHFPMLANTLREVCGSGVAIVDASQTTARLLATQLRKLSIAAPVERLGTVRLLATDGPARFAAVGGRFLGVHVDPQQVELVDLMQ
jgi:glutamate racemase